MQVRKQQLELAMEQQTGSKQVKEYVKAVYCHPAYLTYMQFYIELGVILVTFSSLLTKFGLNSDLDIPDVM